jgi:hypothetical protein
MRLDLVTPVDVLVYALELMAFLFVDAVWGWLTSIGYA